MDERQVGSAMMHEYVEESGGGEARGMKHAHEVAAC